MTLNIEITNLLSVRMTAMPEFAGDRLKVLWWDGTGLCLLSTRHDRATFRVPTTTAPETACVELNERELDALLDAIDVMPPRRPRGPRLH